MKTNAEELRARIFERRLAAAKEREQFFPDAALSEVLTRQTVADVISDTTIPTHEQEDIVKFILSDARKIFCVLVCVRAVPYILNFFWPREIDSRLPFTPAQLEKIDIGDFAREFVSVQWEYVAPVFDKKVLKLDPSYILPFKSEERIPGAEGGYGAVRKVELYNVHQELVAREGSQETVSLSCSEQPQILMVRVHP
jgi:hypothetical protein